MGNPLMRKTRAEYPPSSERAAFVHDHLMAIYWDTPEQSTPRYRLTYARLDQDRLKVRFEIAARRSAK
jgi:hypothetical protein